MRTPLQSPHKSKVFFKYIKSYHGTSFVVFLFCRVPPTRLIIYCSAYLLLSIFGQTIAIMLISFFLHQYDDLNCGFSGKHIFGRRTRFLRFARKNEIFFWFWWENEIFRFWQENEIFGFSGKTRFFFVLAGKYIFAILAGTHVFVFWRKNIFWGCWRKTCFFVILA